MKRLLFACIVVFTLTLGFRPDARSSSYPWQSIFINKGTAPAEFNFKATLDLHIDFGKKLSMDEIKQTRDKIRIVDEDNKQCQLFSYGSGTGAAITVTNQDTGEKISWKADFAVIYRFILPSEADTYTLHWTGCPPLLISKVPFTRVEKRDDKVDDHKKNTALPADPAIDILFICEVQELLTYLGYSTEGIDGLAGPKTQKAITAYQDAHGLPITPKPDRSLLKFLRKNYDNLQKHSSGNKFPFLPDRPANGHVFKAIEEKAIAPLEIVTPRKEKDFLIKIVSKNKIIKMFYIRGGSSVNTKLPLGNFGLKYASGERWFGKNCLFGRKTVYGKADRTFNFTKNGNQVSGYTIELLLQKGGNLPTSNISAQEW